MTLNPPQLFFLGLVALVLFLFAKWKVTGSLTRERRAATAVLDAGYPVFAALACAGALVAAAVGVSALADLALPPVPAEAVKVAGKERVSHGKRGDDYLVRVQGAEGSRRENVSPALFHEVQAGDSLRIERTPIWGEWRSVRLLREGRVVYESAGLDIYAMAVLGVLFILCLYAFPLYFRMRARRITGSLAFLALILFELLPLTMAAGLL